MPKIKIKGLGGFSEIGASAAQLEIFNGVNKNILLDSGIRMHNKMDGRMIVRRSEGHNQPDIEIHAALITHAHADHIGNLPYILDQFPEAKVFMTRPTLAISSQMWNNTSHLMKNGGIDSTLARRLEFAKGTQIAANNLENAVKKPGWVGVFPGVEAYFGPAGHIRGAAFIVIRIDVGFGKYIHIMFTGDISVFDSPTVKGMRLPEEFIGKLDAIIVESTYGNRVFDRSREEEEARMGYIAKETIKGGGICMAAAFGVGRSQDILLDQLIYGVEPTYLDGMGQRILDIISDLEVGQWCDLDHSEGIDLVNDPRILFVKDWEHRQELIYSHKAFSVVATAGMLIEGSCSNQFVTKNHFLEDSKNTLLLTGYQAENTEGREIEDGIEAGRPVQLGNREISVRANVPPRLQLSSHADGLQISDIVKKLRPKKVFIVHGHERGRHGLERNLRNIGFRGEIHLPRNGEPIEI